MFKYTIAAIIGAIALLLFANIQGAWSQELQEGQCVTPIAVTTQAKALNLSIIRDVADPDEISKLKQAVSVQFAVSLEDQVYDRAIYVKFDEETAGVILFKTAASGEQCQIHHWTSSLSEVQTTLKNAFGQEVSN